MTDTIAAGLLIVIEGDRYALTINVPDNAFTLAKEGMPKGYVVAFNTEGQPQCQCPGFEFRAARRRQKWPGSCRHIEALKSVGMIHR